MLTIEALTKNYGETTALDGVSLSAPPGILGLLGPNGAGKSTMMNIASGLLRQTGGSVCWDGREVGRMGAEYRSLLGYLPQGARFYKSFTAEQFLLYMIELKGLRLSRREAGSVIGGLLEKVNLGSVRKKRIGTFSGGMAQRLGIAQALLGEPKLIILDEPTSGLDPEERVRLRNLVSGEAGSSVVIWATHIVADVEFIASSIAILDKGRLVRHGPPDRLVADLEGRIWSLTAPFEAADRIMADFHVRSFTRREDGVFMRILSDRSPHPLALPASPNLEDVYVEAVNS